MELASSAQAQSDYGIQDIEMVRRAPKTCLITGASGSIGLSTALLFHEKGYKVIGVARKPFIASFKMLRADLTKQEDLNTLQVFLHDEKVDSLDVLVTCAAAESQDTQSQSVSLAEWNKIIETDVTAVFRCCQIAYWYMKPQASGSIINLSSFHAFGTYPRRAAYATAKAAIIGLTQALAVEWGVDGIRVNSVAPGPVDGPRLHLFFQRNTISNESIEERTPVRPAIGDPREVAELIYFLSNARHINGETVLIDGGWSKNFAPYSNKRIYGL